MRDVGLTASVPIDDLHGWKVTAEEFMYHEDRKWKLTAYAVCANVVPSGEPRDGLTAGVDGLALPRP